MDKGSIKKVLEKRPIKRLLILTILMGVIAFIIGNKKDYLTTLLIRPIHLTEGTIGKQFLQNKDYIIGDLERLAVYYAGGDMVLQYKEGLGPVLYEEKASSIYYTYIGNQIVLCQYPDTIINPQNILYGKEYKCFAIKFEEMPDFGTVRNEFIRASIEAGYDISMNDFSDTMLIILRPEQSREKKTDALLGLMISSIIFLIWIKSILITMSTRLRRGLIRASKKYGSLPRLYEQIEQEEAIGITQNAMITTNWLVHIKSREIINCNEIVWIYHKCLGTGLLEFNRTYIYTKDEKRYCLVSRDISDIINIYDKLIQRRPYIKVGYTKELDEKWKLNPRSFVQEIQ